MRPTTASPFGHNVPRPPVGAARIAAHAALLFAGLALGALLGLAEQPPAGADVPAAPAQATPRGLHSRCTGAGTVEVVTGTIRTCEETEVVVRAEATCQRCPAGVNVVLVMPEWAEEPNWIRSEGQQVIDELVHLQDRDTDDFDSPVRIGVVRFSDTRQGSGVALRLTERIRAARGEINAKSPAQCVPRPPLPPDGPDRCGCITVIQLLGPAVAKALGLIRDVRRDAGIEDAREACDTVIVFYEGIRVDCDTYSGAVFSRLAIMAGRNLEHGFGTMLVGCPSTNDDNCYAPRTMASSPRFYSQAPQRGQIRGALRGVFDDLAKGRMLRDLAIVQHIPVGLGYVPGSASITPTAMITATDGVTLTWSWERLGVTGPHEVRYRVAPKTTGAFTITGQLDIGDFENRQSTQRLPEAVVSAFEPCVTPTPMPTDTPIPSPTQTASSTPIPTATRTATPTAAATREPLPLYLPLALGERCDDARRAADIALVIDASTSMLERTVSGPSKLDASLAAARSFLDLLQLAEGRDRAAIISFNAEARILQPLTQDRAALEAALAAIEPRTQTCLPCAVEIGEEALEVGTSAGRARTKTLVLLTDGRSNPRPASEAVERATLAKGRGVIIFTVGIGDELDVDALREIASEGRFFFQSPDAEDLGQIYGEIAGLIPCPSFWPDEG